MWKKEDAQKGTAGRPEHAAATERPAPSSRSGERATIGRSITIRGDVTGDEDLVIQGQVEGSVNLDAHSVTVGPEGDVKADINGRVVIIEGHVKGNLRATEQVILRESARLEGDISAPRIMLEDGAYFRGGVDMAEQGGQGHTGGPQRRDAAGGVGAGGASGSAGSDKPATGTSVATDTGTGAAQRSG